LLFLAYFLVPGLCSETGLSNQEGFSMQAAGAFEANQGPPTSCQTLAFPDRAAMGDGPNGKIWKKVRSIKNVIIILINKTN